MNEPSAADERILRQRAAALAAPVQRAVDDVASQEVLQVGIGEAACVVPLRAVSSVVPIDELAGLPGAPPTIAGLANLAGQVVTVIHLAQLFGEHPRPPRVALLIETREGALALGVDRYDGVIRHRRDQVLPLPHEDGRGAGRFLDGALPGGVGILSVERVLDSLLDSGRGDAP